MRLLLDTRLWVWIAAAPGRLSPEARAVFADPRTDLSWSVVTIWEVAIKLGMGRDDFFSVEPAELLDFLRSGPFTELPVLAEHVLPLGTLPQLHRDPSDRLPIAQAVAEGVTPVTADRKVADCPGPIRRV